MLKITKRTISIILALIMAMPIILTMPFSAGANAGNVYEYLTSSSTFNNNVNATNVYWDSNENAAAFDGNNSFLTLTNSPFSSVTADSGFTVSIDVKRSTNNGEWARIFDFGNGQSNYFALNGGRNRGQSGDTRRFCVLTKLNGSEIRYYADGGGQGTVVYCNSDFLATEEPDEWHNIKLVLYRTGSNGRINYYIDDTLFYIYEVSNYVNMLDNFRNNMATYYVGKGFYDADGTFKGYIRNLRITNNSGVNESLLFDYDFGSNFNDSLGNAEGCGAWQANGGNGTYGTYGDHIYLQNAYLTTSFPESFRSDANKKNWRVDFAFNFVSGHDMDSNAFVPVLSLSNNSTSNSDYSNSFSVGRNGKIYYKTSNVNNYIGDTGVDFTGSGNQYVANKSRQRLSIAYTDGKICVYYNDILKFKKDNLSNDEKTFFENIYGANLCGNGSDVSWMDIWDFRAYNNSNSNHPSFNQLKTLGAAAKAYEDAMQTGTVYTNIKNAYDKYVELNKLVDAISTGSAGVSDEVAQNVANNLTNAKNNMGTWSSKTFSTQSNAKTKWASNADHATEPDWNYSYNIADAYKNVLWSGGISSANPGANDYTDACAIGPEENTWKSGSSKNSIRPVIYRETAVIVYDGITTPTMPIMFRVRAWKSNNGTFKQRHRAVYIKSNGQGAFLDQKWRGTDGQLNFILTYFARGGVRVTTDNWEKSCKVDYRNVHSTATDSYNEVSKSMNAESKSFCYANLLKYNGDFDGNSKTIQSIQWGFISSNNDDGRLDQQATEGDTSNNSAASQHPIYVINYKKVRNALSNAANGKAKQVASYKEGGLSDFFTKFENAENFNPQDSKYTYSSNASSAVSSCANDLGSVVNNLNDASARANVYDNLKNALYIKHDQTGYSAAEDMLKSDEFTTTSYNAFKAKYIEAINKLARLVDNGYATDLGSIASDLNTAHGNLEKRADFSNLDSTFTTVQGNYDALNKSIYTPNSCTAFESYMSGLTYHSKNASQRADIGVSSQSSINSEATAVSGAISTYLKRRANLNPFFDKYNELNDIVSGFNSNAALYTESSLNALINALNDPDVQKYVNASDETLANYEAGGEEEAEAEDLKDDLIEAFNSLKDADQGETEGDLDLSAYQAVVESINNLDNDAYNYSPEDRAKDLNTYTKTLTKTVEYNGTQIKVLKDNVSESLVNAVVSFLQSRANSHIREYKITVSGSGLSNSAGVTFSGGRTRYDETENAYYATYGTKVNLKADFNDAAWYMQFDSETAGRNEQYQDTGKYFSAIVFGNLNVTVKTKNDGNKVTIYRVYDDNDRTPISRIDYVDGKYTVPSASALPYYSFEGYTLENGDEIEAGDKLDTDGNIVIYAHYDAAVGLPFAINIEDDEIESQTASYNDSVSIQGNEGTYAWLEKIGDTNNYKSFYIGKDVTFFATESITLKPVTETQFNDGRYRVPSINVRQSGPYIIETEGKKRVTFNGQFVTDGSFPISEYGIIIGKATDGGSIKASDVNLENVGVNEGYSVIRLKSTKDVGAHQFTMSVTGLSGDVIYKGYISYTNAGVTTTVYTDEMYLSV